MLDVVPFMILATVVVVIVAGWGVARSGMLAEPRMARMVRLPEAEADFAACMAERGASITGVRVYRDPVDGDLVLTGPGDIDPAIAEDFAACDRLINDRYARTGR